LTADKHQRTGSKAGLVPAFFNQNSSEVLRSSFYFFDRCFFVVSCYVGLIGLIALAFFVQPVICLFFFELS
jgi:hypothetical protein